MTSFFSSAVLKGRLCRVGLCGLLSKSMFELDVSLQINAVRLVLQTVTIGYAAPVRDIFKKGDAQNLLMNGLAILKKKLKKRSRRNEEIASEIL